MECVVSQNELLWCCESRIRGGREMSLCKSRLVCDQPDMFLQPGTALLSPGRVDEETEEEGETEERGACEKRDEREHSPT